MLLRHLLIPSAALALAAVHAPAALAQAAPAPATTIDLVATGSSVSAGLADGQALNLRLVSQQGGDDLWRAELLQERRFGATGGVAGVGLQRGLSADWYAGANLTLGHGGPNWARRRLDLSLGTKLGAQRDTLLLGTAYRALYDNQRSDTGLGLTLVAYAWSPLVLQAGLTFNVSDPGAVHSTMGTLAATWGRQGAQTFTARVSAGTEGYQALGDAAQLVDFRSRSAALQWRRWLAPHWGLSAQLEHYHNPSYDRLSLSAGVFGSF